MNPFTVVGYQSPEYFCDREKETEAIRQAIFNNRSVNLISIRRLGKTALIRNVFHSLDKKVYVPIYIDLEGTDSLRGFITRFSMVASAAFSSLDSGWIQTMLKWASGIGASVTLDPFTGIPTVDLSHSSKIQVSSLDALLSNFNQHKDKVFVIAFDEFQEVTKYDDKNTEGWLRSIMQSYPNIRFLFSGSEKSIMAQIFSDPARPFYQISQPMQLGYIPEDSYRSYILSKLEGYRDQIGEREVNSILEWCRCHTYYVQYFCNLLYEKLENGLFESIEMIKMEILESQKHFFHAQKNLLTAIQWKTLKAIAKVGEVKNVSSNEFLSFSGLAQTSARRSVEALLERGMLLEESGVIKVYNVFLSRYLETLE